MINWATGVYIILKLYVYHLPFRFKYLKCPVIFLKKILKIESTVFLTEQFLSNFIQMRSLLIPECQRQKGSRNATKMEQSLAKVAFTNLSFTTKV